MNPVPMVAFSIIAAFLSLLLKDKKREYSLALSLIGSAFIMISALMLIFPVISSVNEFLTETDSENLKIVLKALGIGYLSSFAADTCKDAGEVSLASKIELYGKAGVIAVSFPLLRSLLTIARELLK